MRKEHYPIRCFTCGKVLLEKCFLEMNELKKLNDVKKNQEFFYENGIDRYCCRKVLISSKGLKVIRSE